MKKIFLIIINLLIMTRLLIPLSCIADEETSIYSEISDVDKGSFSSEDEWRTYIKSENEKHKKSNLRHEKIQERLDEKGILGLNKFQYHQLLTEEMPENISENELLILFNGSQQQFKNIEYNELFEKFRFSIDFCSGTLVESYTNEEMVALIGQLIQDPYIDFIQPDFVYEYSNFMSDIDYTYTLTQAMEQINATTAWDYTRGEDIRVGVIDSGINDIGVMNRHSSSTDETCDYPGICKGHGTAVATVIGGNCEYIGVAPECTIYGRGVHGHDTNGAVSSASSSLIPAIKDLVSKNCRVINISLHLSTYDLFSYLLSTYTNVLFVQSAGNDKLNLADSTQYSYSPSSNYLRVAAVDRYDNLCSFSNYSSNGSVQIAAPGMDLSLPTKDGDFTYFSGTSFAAPMVAGAAALLLSIDPDLTAAEMKTILLETADVVPDLKGYVGGSRRLNVGQAVWSLEPEYGNRCAIITNTGTLKVQDNSSNGWVTIEYGVKNVVLESNRVIYIRNDNHVFYRVGDLSNPSVELDSSGTATSLKASGLNLYVHHSDNKLYKYKVNTGTGLYVSGGNFTNIKYYAIEGNRLVLVYTGQPKQMRVFENAYRKTSSADGVLAYTKYTFDSNLSGVYMIGSRIHVLQNGDYNMFDSTVYTKGDNPTLASMEAVITRQDVHSCSMNQYRWCCVVVGNKLAIYGFKLNSEGKTSLNTADVVSIESPSGQNIDSCLVENYRVYYLSGGALYYATADDEALSYGVAGGVTAYAVKGSRVGFINSSNEFLYKNDLSETSWTRMNIGVKKIVLGS